MHVATVGFASAALFLLGFYVIPVFAEKAPQVVSDLSRAQAVTPTQSSQFDTKSTLTVDQDQDGIPDVWEQQIGSETLLADTDGDGVADGLEVSLKKK